MGNKRGRENDKQRKVNPTSFLADEQPSATSKSRSKTPKLHEEDAEVISQSMSDKIPREAFKQQRGIGDEENLERNPTVTAFNSLEEEAATILEDNANDVDDDGGLTDPQSRFDDDYEVDEPASNGVEDSSKQNKRFEKLRRRLMKDAKKAKNKGVCYLSRIPPKMDPSKLRHLLTPFGEVLRIYLVPEDPDAGKRRKQSGSFRGQGFSEGWVEFSDKCVAKRVANMLNGEQIGGKKRSKFYYDIWNIKYLSKFKWDDLTDESARKNAAREEKLRMELVAAKKEKDFYISKVEMSRALSEIDERMKKKRKTQNGTEDDSKDHIEHRKVIRQFPQKQPLAEPSEKNQLKLSKGFLAEIFNKN